MLHVYPQFINIVFWVIFHCFLNYSDHNDMIIKIWCTSSSKICFFYNDCFIGGVDCVKIVWQVGHVTAFIDNRSLPSLYPIHEFTENIKIMHWIFHKYSASVYILCVQIHIRLSPITGTLHPCKPVRWLYLSASSGAPLTEWLQSYYSSYTTLATKSLLSCSSVIR